MENQSVNEPSGDDVFAQLKNETQQEISSIVGARMPDAQLSADQQKQYLQERLYHMVDYAIGRHDWYDEQRNRFLQIGLGLTAAAAAIAAVLTQLKTSVHILTGIFLWLSVAALFATGLLLIYKYNRGVERDHPYRKIADIRSWYFMYNFPNQLGDDLRKERELAEEQVQIVKQSLQAFVTRWFEYAKDPNGFLKEDLEQVFILQTLQRYRYQQVKELSSTLFRGIVVSAILLVLTVSSFFLAPQPTNPESQQVDSRGGSHQQVDSRGGSHQQVDDSGGSQRVGPKQSGSDSNK